MNYELALKLKEAGFPASNEWIDGGTNFFIDKGELVYEAPTLSELIAACGEHFERLTHFGNGEWEAKQFKRNSVIGNSPEEAVAKLWLKLYGKQ